MIPPDPIRRAQRCLTSLWQTLAHRPILRTQFEAEFPRPIVTLFLEGFEIPVIPMAPLTHRLASSYLTPHSTPNPSFMDNTPLWGLLHIGYPYAVVFLSKRLTPAQQRYVLAHEVGHCTADILRIAQQWDLSASKATDLLRTFFFGLNTPSESDALYAALRSLPSHPASMLNSNAYVEREIMADLIARELLAPWETVVPLAQRLDSDSLYTQLTIRFQLPPRYALGYIRDLQLAVSPPQDVISTLFDSPSEK